MTLPIKTWTNGVPVEAGALAQLEQLASLPFIHKHIAVMPDVHVGIGATVGSVVPTVGAVIPAAVGVDIGCGMMAVQTSLTASRLPDSLAELRSKIEAAVPHGRTSNGGAGDKGAHGTIESGVGQAWVEMLPGFNHICEKHPAIAKCNNVTQLGTLGTGNHFIELCLDEQSRVWVMLHSGSRGVGSKIGSYFIELAKKDMGIHLANLPNKDLAYLQEGTQHFDDYVVAVSWAQRFARVNRELMMGAVLGVLANEFEGLQTSEQAVNCHHNYVAFERHFDRDCIVTRKGAVRAGRGDLGIIPGSMGAKSFIVRGLGNPESFESCSHGAGRVMSRTAAKKAITIEDHVRDTEGVECRKDIDVIDESPAAYKQIDAVMAAQKDLVEIVHTLKQVLCVKG